MLGPGADVAHLVLGEEGLGVQAAVTGLGVVPIKDRGHEVARSVWCRPGGDGVGAGDPAVLGHGAGGALVAVPRVSPVTLDVL